MYGFNLQFDQYQMLTINVQDARHCTFVEVYLWTEL